MNTTNDTSRCPGWFAAVVVAVVSLWGATADAQTGGIRAGVSGDPGQFHFGGHLETGALIERVTFRPNVEAGVGDNLTILSFNLEFVYGIPLRGRPWRTYLGGGPALVVIDTDGRPGQSDGSSAEGGFNILAGLEHDRGLFFELKVGALDSPDVKFTVGYSFH